jgi:hypothetical protein
MKIRLADDFVLPDDAATQVFAFIGRRGSGKTYGAGRLIEQLREHGDQVVILDPVGVWWGLRLAADGKSPGLEIPVFGGWHGDIPLQATAGKVVAELVAERGTSLVLDVSDFTGADQRRFVADFAAELFHAKKRHRSAVMVVFEEAQEFAPQHVRGDVAKMVGAVERLVKLGRNFGVGVTLISQRPQAVNKDVLNLTEILCAFQLVGPQERKTIQGWVQEKGAEGREEVANALPALPVGTAMIWSPQWLRHFGRHKLLGKSTFDASATPKHGKTQTTAKLAPIDLEAVKAAMASTVEQAKANDPKALRAEVARLQRELAAAGKAAPAAKPVEVRVEVVPIAVIESLRALGRTLASAVQDVGTVANIAADYEAAAAAPRAPRNFPINPDGHKSWRQTAKARRPAAPGPMTNGEWRPMGGALRMLQAIATSHADGLTWRQVAQLSGMKASGGSFGTYKSALRSHGCVEERGGLVFLTDAGSAFAGDPGAPMSGPELLEYWQQKLPGKAKDMLREVWAVGPRGSITRAALAETVGMEAAGGSFGTYLSSLRSNGLVEDGPDGLTAAEVFFR